jgi:succinate-acetate transporter protein
MAQYAAERAEAAAPAVANPSPLGLSAFALTTFVLSASNAGFLFSKSTAGADIVIGLALFYGGLVQLVAGVQAFRAGNTFAATAFCSYAGFWMSFAVAILPIFAGGTKSIVALIAAPDTANAVGVFLLGWTIFTGIMFLCTLRSTVVTMGVFFLLFLTFLALTIGWLGGLGSGTFTTFVPIGGWLGIATAIVAWYDAFAGVLASSKSMFKLPTFPVS